MTDCIKKMMMVSILRQLSIEYSHIMVAGTLGGGGTYMIFERCDGI